MSIEDLVHLIERLTYLVIIYIIPVFSSYQILKSNDKEKIQKNLHYWVALVVLDFCRMLIDPICNRFDIFAIPKLLFFIWFVHPYFKGYEIVYSFVIQQCILPNQERIANCLQFFRETQYRYLTYVVQYVMKFFDSCVKQINELIAKKPPSKHIK